MTELDRFTKMMNGLEGNRPVPYTLKDKKSGITIGRGLDLGQHNVSDLKRMGLPPELIKRFVDAGFLGKQGQAARDHLKKSGKFILSEQEMLQLNGKLMTSKIADFNRDYENYMGESASKLSENQRFALQSAHFNLGENLFKAKGGGVTDLTKQLRDKDFKAAAYNLANWHGGNATQPLSRRAAEGTLLGGSIGYEDMEPLRNVISKQGAVKFMADWKENASPTSGVNNAEDPEAQAFANPYELPPRALNRPIQQQPEQLSEFSSGKITRPALKPLDQGRMVTRDQVTPVVLSDPTNLPAVNETPTNILRDGYGNAVRSGTGDFIYTGFDNPLL